MPSDLQHLTLQSKINYEGLIVCDGCKERAPTKCCGQCRSCFYCSKQCQVKHWKSRHKTYCNPIEETRKLLGPKPPLPIPQDNDGVEAVNTECCVCTTDPIPDPVILPSCQHAFCGPCLGRWNVRLQRERDGAADSSEEVTVCPLCRQETPGQVHNRLQNLALLYCERAMHISFPKHLKRSHAEVGLRACEKFKDGREIMSLRFLMVRVNLLIVLGRGQEALDAFYEYDAINAKRVAVKAEIDSGLEKLQAAQAENRSVDMTLVDRVGMLIHTLAPNAYDIAPDTPEVRNVEQLTLSKALLLAGHFADARDSYMDLFTNGADPLKIMPGVAEACYRLGDYRRAIEASNTAFHSSRYFYGIYKWKALSQKALGQLDEAIKTMKIAALYETPWDNANRSKVIQLHNELVDEKLAMEKQAEGADV